jgi:hypothetical protein
VNQYRSRLASSFFVALAFSVSVTAGCAPSVGSTCDEPAARTPYFREGSGEPAYPGQALLNVYCAGCHNTPGGFGVPVGLEMTLPLVTSTDTGGVDQMRALRANQSIVHGNRDLIYQQVLSGSMPPRNFVGSSVTYADRAGVELPGIHTEEGRDMLRNWLACGSPVVERTAPIACTANGMCPLTNFCDTEDGVCVGVGDVVPPAGTVDCATPEATFAWIYPCIIQENCAGAPCHVGGTAGGLAMPDIDTAFTNLTTGGPNAMSGAECMGQEDYVVDGMPDNSLLIHKLEGVDETGAAVCELRMPVGPVLSDSEIELIRMWIMNSAPRE